MGQPDRDVPAVVDPTDKLVAVVTGGGSGIGRASAVAFARAGYVVLVADRDDDAGARTVESIGAERAAFVHTDVTVEADSATLFERAARLGTVRAVHNNAGVISGDVELHEITLDEWNAVLAVNVTGAFLVLREAIRVLRRNVAVLRRGFVRQRRVPHRRRRLDDLGPGPPLSG